MSVESNIRLRVRAALTEELQKQTRNSKWYVDTRALLAGDDLVQVNAVLSMSALTEAIADRIFGADLADRE
ncbi:hypothetical protein SEA_JANGDYNASTY_1 [Mycobacterium phage JangDynasty]|nr:hypothetical protein SEA_JANGDYNASTY_1 [Mycobacterium phage JangDynasty]